MRGRESWTELLSAQGFTPVVAAGQAAAAPRLLSRQVVVMGVSDGVILGPPSSHMLRTLQTRAAPVPASLLEGFKDLELRDSLPGGASSYSYLNHVWYNGGQLPPGPTQIVRVHWFLERPQSLQ